MRQQGSESGQYHTPEVGSRSSSARPLVGLRHRAVGDHHRLVQHLLLGDLLEVLRRVGLFELQREVERRPLAIEGFDPAPQRIITTIT